MGRCLGAGIVVGLSEGGILTNCGLAQASMTYMNKVKGESYHWAKELYSELGLPVEAISTVLERDNMERMRRLEKKKRKDVKARSVQQKKDRTTDAKRRRDYTQRLKVIHNYGEEEEDVLDENDLVRMVEGELKDEMVKPICMKTVGVSPPKGALISISDFDSEIPIVLA